MRDDTRHDPVYGSLEENISCGYGESQEMHGRHEKDVRRHRRHQSKMKKDYERLDESVGMREYEMHRK